MPRRRLDVGETAGDRGDERVAAPPRDHGDQRRRETGQRACAKPGPEHLPKLRRCRGRRGMLPALRLAHEQPHQNATPAGMSPHRNTYRHAISGAPGNTPPGWCRHVGREEEAQRRRRVEEGARLDATFLRHDFGDHRGTCRPLAADPERRNDPAQHEHQSFRRKRTCRGADRVQRHREEQRARSADPIGDLAEHDPAHGPADEQQRCQATRPLERRGRASGVPSGMSSSVGTQFGAT